MHRSRAHIGRRQRGYADALVPLITLLALGFGAAFLSIFIASFVLPTFRLRGGARIGGFLVVAGIWSGVYWWNSGEPERLSLTRSSHYKHFEAACKNAGVTIFRTVSDVASIAFQAPRAETTNRDLQDTHLIGDVYGELDLLANSAERNLVFSFLTKKEWEKLWYVPTQDEFLRYPQVEIAATEDGKPGFFRYTDSSVGSVQKFSRSFVPTPTSAFMVRWEDISTPADREHWIAGSKWSIIDIATAQVLGQRIAYAIDLDQGRTAWGSTGGDPALPWIRAGHVQYRRYNVENACPPKPSRLYNLEFVRSVLKPISQNMIVVPIPGQ